MYIFIAIALFFILYFLLNPGLFTGKPPDGFAKESDVLSFWNKGIGITGKNKRNKLKDAFRHTLICGQSGSGKSQCSYIPELLRANGSKSYIVHDISGEIEATCGGYLHSKNYDIKVIDLASIYSNYYNPLQHIDESFSKAKQVASIIVSTTLGDNNGEGKFFNIKAEQLLSVLIAATKQLAPKYHHMGSVVTLLNAMSTNPVGLDFFMADKCKGKVFEEYSAIAATDPKLMSNITSTTKAAISIFEDENIMRLTSASDFSFSQLRETPTVVYLKSSIMSLRYHAPVFSLIIIQLMETLLAKLPGSRDLPVVMHLDEMGVLKLPNFSDFLSNSRKYKVACVLGCQTTSQIINKYQKEEGNNIFGNCFTHLYFSNQPLETCLMLEKMAGTVELEIEKGRTEKRLVLPSNQVRILDPRKAILLAGGVRPVLVGLKPAYKNFVLKQRMNLSYERNIPELKNEEIPLPYIPRPKRVKG